jgi:hypothetical protein
MCRHFLPHPRPTAIFGKLLKSVVALPLAIVAVATPATPQIIAGRVVDAGSGEPIDGVTITAVASLDMAHGSVVSNVAGEFLIVIPSAGTYVLRADRLGYATARTRPIEIGADEAVEVELRLNVEAVELEPLTVVVRRRENLRERDLREFYERADYYGEPHLGSIRIFTREFLNGRDAYTADDALRYYSPWWRSFGRTCDPKVFLDGRPVSGVLLAELKFMSLRNVEGIEFYRGFGPTNSRFVDQDDCGVALVWSRPHPPGHTKLAVAGGALVVLAVVSLPVF